MSVEATHGAACAEPDTTPRRRLIVAWQHPQTRRYEAVGLLTEMAGLFTFCYLPRAQLVPGFPLLPGFPNRDETYTATQLFPLFAQRVMNPRRPDYRSWVVALGLSTAVSAWDVLARSQGHRLGDSIRVFPEPDVDERGHTSASFFVHGLRYRLAGDPEVARALLRLRAGDRLRLTREPTNPVNPHAVQVESGVSLGYVPDVLADYVGMMLVTALPVASAQRINGPDVPPNLRLLVRVTGLVPNGYRPFDDLIQPLSVAEPCTSHVA